MPTNFAAFVALLLSILSLVIPFIFALTLLVITWKVINLWIINSADQYKREEGKQVVLVGIVVLVIMSGIWGIIAILRSSLFW